MPAGAFAQSAAFEWIQQIPGSQGQTIAGIGTDAQGNTYVAGTTASVDLSVKSAVQPHPGGSGLYRVDGPKGGWQNLSSAGFSAVTSLAADPQDPQSLYAATSRGLFHTADAGATWTAVTAPPGILLAIAVDPSDANVLYAGTTPGVFGSTAGGVYKSTDAGATWTPMNNGLQRDSSGGLRVDNIWIDPRRPQIILASSSQGLVRSADAGGSWQPVTQPLPNYGLMSISWDPSTPGVAYYAMGAGLEKSTDDGATWTALTLPQEPGFVPTSVAVDPRHAGILYVSSIETPGGIYMSTDGGNTWTQKSNALAGPLAIDPATGAIYAAIANGPVVVTTDGFNTTTPLGPSIIGLVTLQLAGSHLFVGAGSSVDVFVAKFDPQGNPIYLTYFGGASNDQANGMALDPSGAVYVTGTTLSSDFPLTSRAYSKTGGSFLLKLNADGSLGYSTYFAASGTTPKAIAVDAAGHAFVAGSTVGNLPTTPGAYQPMFQGSTACCSILGPGLPPPTNAFLTEFDASGSSLVFSTYIGKQNELAQTIALAPDGNVILGGGAQLYRMKGDGSELLNSMALPGYVWALVADGAGNIYAGGQTAGSNFPATSGAFQTAPFHAPVLPGNEGNIGAGDGFVTKFDSQFHVLASTLLGGEAPDETLALGISPDGNIVAAGSTSSKAFPTRGPAQTSFSNGTGFLMELTPDLSKAVFSTYTGDTRTFYAGAVAAAPDGSVLFAGNTSGAPAYFTYVPIDNKFPADATFQAFIAKTVLRPAAPRIDTVVNAASQLGVALSPGEVFTINGDTFGNDVALIVNGNAVPLISETRTALTAMLPLDFNVTGAATVVVESGGNSSNSVLVPTAATSPGLYSVDGSGVGQGYILNADATMNSPSNPAKAGSKITIFATGVGHMTFDQGYAVTDSPVAVFIDSFYANGIAATLAPAPGLPGNVYQISVYVPDPPSFASVNPNLKDFVYPPQVAVALAVNGGRSQAGLAVSVTQ